MNLVNWVNRQSISCNHATCIAVKIAVVLLQGSLLLLSCLIAKRCLSCNTSIGCFRKRAEEGGKGCEGTEAKGGKGREGKGGNRPAGLQLKLWVFCEGDTNGVTQTVHEERSNANG